MSLLTCVNTLARVCLCITTRGWNDWRRVTDRLTEISRQTDRHTDIVSDRKTDLESERPTYKQTARQSETEKA